MIEALREVPRSLLEFLQPNGNNSAALNNIEKGKGRIVCIEKYQQV